MSLAETTGAFPRRPEGCSVAHVDCDFLPVCSGTVALDTDQTLFSRRAT